MPYNYLNAYIFFGPQHIDMAEDEIKKAYEKYTNSESCGDGDDLTLYTLNDYSIVVHDFINTWNNALDDEASDDYHFTITTQVPDNNNLFCVVFGCEGNSMCGSDPEEELAHVTAFAELGLEKTLGIYRG